MSDVAYIDYLPDNAAECLSKAPSLARQCKDCPYTPGTPASLDAVTSRIAKECAESRCGFFCHKSIDDRGIPSHLCAGWVEAISVKQ